MLATKPSYVTRWNYVADFLQPKNLIKIMSIIYCLLALALGTLLEFQPPPPLCSCGRHLGTDKW